MFHSGRATASEQARHGHKLVVCWEHTTHSLAASRPSFRLPASGFRLPAFGTTALGVAAAADDERVRTLASSRLPASLHLSRVTRQESVRRRRGASESSSPLLHGGVHAGPLEASSLTGRSLDVLPSHFVARLKPLGLREVRPRPRYCTVLYVVSDLPTRMCPS